MMPRTPLNKAFSADDKKVIKRFLRRMETDFEHLLGVANKAVKVERNRMTENQQAYARHARGAIRKCLSLL